MTLSLYVATQSSNPVSHVTGSQEVFIRPYVDGDEIINYLQTSGWHNRSSASDGMHVAATCCEQMQSQNLLLMNTSNVINWNLKSYYLVLRNLFQIISKQLLHVRKLSFGLEINLVLSGDRDEKVCVISIVIIVNWITNCESSGSGNQHFPIMDNEREAYM